MIQIAGGIDRERHGGDHGGLVGGAVIAGETDAAAVPAKVLMLPSVRDLADDLVGGVGDVEVAGAIDGDVGGLVEFGV